MLRIFCEKMSKSSLQIPVGHGVKNAFRKFSQFFVNFLQKNVQNEEPNFCPPINRFIKELPNAYPTSQMIALRRSSLCNHRLRH